MSKECRKCHHLEEDCRCFYDEDFENKIIKELQSLGFKTDDNAPDIFIGHTDTLRVRIIKGRGVVDFAEKEAFDRWANSCDFTVDLTNFQASEFEWSIKRAFEIATQICQSGIVDFNKFEMVNAELGLMTTVEE